MEKLSFYTLGDEFTELVRDLIRSGSFYNAIEILKDGGFDDNYVLKFLDGKIKFEGDTRQGGLEVLDDDHQSPLIVGWQTYCNQEGIDYTDLDRHESIKHTKSLFKIISIEDFSAKFYKELLIAEKFTIYTEPPSHNVEDGVFLQTGEFVECGFQGHRDLYPHLLNLGLVTHSDWTEDEKCIHISSKNLSGKVAYSIAKDFYGRIVSEAQLDSLMKWKDHFNSFYSERRGSVIDAVRKAIITRENRGAKWGNLMFLDRYYKDIKLPTLSKEPFREGQYAIRTSPKVSIPGILNSKFNITSSSKTQALKQIEDDWNEAKDIRKGNALHVFYQRLVEGDTGVCHYKEKGDFTYRVGKRHEVVNGGVGRLGNIDLIHNQLRPIARKLYQDLGKQIQLEFVDTGKEIIIVQLRTIHTPTFEERSTIVPERLICTGRSFTKGRKVVELKDCIVVQNEIDSKDVVDKEAIIVRDNVDFSHALALSQKLYIPSIYGIGDVDLPEKFEIDTKYLTGTIREV